jgi:hypothetical protein
LTDEVRWTWPEYKQLTDEVAVFTGAKTDPSKTLGEIVEQEGAQEQKPMSLEEKQREEEERRRRREWRARQVDDYYLWRWLHSKFLRLYGFRRMVLSNDRLDSWETPNNMPAEVVAELAFPSLSEKKLDNRIQRFEQAAERMSQLADLLEERLEEDGTIRRLK